MKTSWLYLIIGILLAAVVGFAVYSYREESKSGVELKMGEDGISIQEN